MLNVKADSNSGRKVGVRERALLFFFVFFVISSYKFAISQRLLVRVAVPQIVYCIIIKMPNDKNMVSVKQHLV